MTPPEDEQKKENPLRIGMCSLDELEEKIKAFRIMNQSALKKRYVLSREVVTVPGGQVILQKSTEIDISRAKLLRRHFPGNHMFKSFQPDEGIVIISDMSSPEGISLSMDIVTQIMNIGGGAYEGFIDRVDSFTDFLNLLKKALFPKLIIIGYIPPERLEMEKINFVRARRVDHYIRAIELTHTQMKTQAYFPKIKQVQIDTSDPRSWGRFIIEIVREYTKPYFVEDF
ncbi:MAG: hypothetical protein KDK34_21655 [Leptospiraceae bacterium]|nr:hypothetical protein [Leptospiraceae bacterium]MCB1322879.1 hypothetical protein [Leptospiraceae bacterium]